MKPTVTVSKQLVVVNSLSSVLTRVLNISVLLWLQQYLLRRISAEEYSLYPVLMSVMVFTPFLTTVLTSGLSRYLTEAYARSDEKRITQIVSTMFPLLLGAGLLLFSFGALFAWHVDSFLTIAPGRLWDARVMMLLLVFSTAVRLPLAPFGTGLYIRQKFVLLNLIGLGGQLLRIALLFLLLFCVSTRVLWVVVSTVAANTCGLIVLQIISVRLIPSLRFRFSEIRWGIASVLTSFGAWNVLGEISSMIQRGADSIILNKLATAVDVTCFYLGFMVENHLRSTITMALAPLQPTLIGMHATGESRRLRNIYFRGGRYALWVALSVIVPVVIYREELVELYVGEEYRDTATVLLLLLSIYPIHYGNVMASKLAHASARMRSWVLRLLTIQISNLLLTLYLVGVRQMGAVGSALSSFLISVVGIPLLLWPLGLQLAGAGFGRWLRVTVWPGVFPALVGGAVWYALRLLFVPHSWLLLGVCSVCGGVFYLGTLLCFCLQSDEREDLKRAMKKLFAVVPIRRKR